MKAPSPACQLTILPVTWKYWTLRLYPLVSLHLTHTHARARTRTHSCTHIYTHSSLHEYCHPCQQACSLTCKMYVCMLYVAVLQKNLPVVFPLLAQPHTYVTTRSAIYNSCARSPARCTVHMDSIQTTMTWLWEGAACTHSPARCAHRDCETTRPGCGRRASSAAGACH